MAERSDKPIVLPAPTPNESQGNIGAERRTQDRIPLTAAADVYEMRSQTRVQGRCTDLSAGGCYVDTLIPFAVGSMVRVRIERDKREFEATAIVTYAHASMGMGLAFTEIKPEHREVLGAWIADLIGEKAPKSFAPEPAPATEAKDAGADPRFVLNELIGLLFRKKVISESEAAELLRQTFR